MDLYNDFAYQTSRQMTLKYSSSFGISSKLFSSDIKKHIYAIYGLVRVADEIVDTYMSQAAAEILEQLRSDTYLAIDRGYSVNPLVHSFALTARQYGIDKTIINPFFDSMAMDLSPKTYNTDLYHDYIHGSAEVVGLMCLRVFFQGDDRLYAKLRDGAAALGAGYQKVNFLRDLAADHGQLDRIYFPGYTFDSFDEAAKMSVIADIEADFNKADAAIKGLPSNCQTAVRLSLNYYSQLLYKLKITPIQVIKRQRVRVKTAHKLWILLVTIIKEKIK